MFAVMGIMLKSRQAVAGDAEDVQLLIRPPEAAFCFGSKSVPFSTSTESYEVCRVFVVVLPLG